MNEIKLEDIKTDYHVGLEAFLCGANKQPDCKEDCYFYGEDHDMGATIRFCTYGKIEYGECPCNGCTHYLGKNDSDKIVRKALEK